MEIKAEKGERTEVKWKEGIKWDGGRKRRLRNSNYIFQLFFHTLEKNGDSQCVGVTELINHLERPYMMISLMLASSCLIYLRRRLPLFLEIWLRIILFMQVSRLNFLSTFYFYCLRFSLLPSSIGFCTFSSIYSSSSISKY